MNYEVFIDPGRSSGVVWYHYDDTTPFTLDGAAQFDGGLPGLLIWLGEMREYLDVVGENTWHSEKFKPLNMPGMSHTLDSTYPLVVEGGLVTLGLLPEYESGSDRWAFASSQYWVGGKDKAEKRRKQRKFLKDHGLYRTGSDLGAPDNEDFCSAMFHALSRMRRIKHKATMLHYFGEDTRM